MNPPQVLCNKANLIPKNTILLVNRSGILKHTLPVGITRRPVAINQDIKALICTARIHPEYLAHLVKAAEPNILKWVRATTADNFPIQNLKELQIPLPPLEEQKRIAGILDQADALRRLRTRALEKLNTLGQAIFHEMFGESVKPSSIEALLNDKILLLHKDGNHCSNYPRKEEFGETGVPFLSAKAIDDNGNLIGSSVEYLSESKANSLKIGWITEDDVLLSHNASVGKVARYRGEFGEALIGTSLTCFRPNQSKLKSSFLEFALKSFAFQDQLTSNMSQTTRNQVPITAQKRLSLTIPSLDEQSAFESKASGVMLAQASATKFLKQSEILFASLQHRAFRGDL